MSISDNPYLSVFKNASLDVISKTEKDYLITKATKLVEDLIVPAYADLAEFMRNTIYLIQGINWYKDVPNGKEWYEYLARYHKQLIFL